MATKNNKKSNASLSKNLANYTLDNPNKITFTFLKTHLWNAADILRGSLDASEYRQPIMTILFLKRLNDTFEENAERLETKERKSHKEGWENKYRHTFFVPKEARWSVLSSTAENIGEKGRDLTSWDEYFLTQEQREFKSEFFKSPENDIQILIVVDMLVVGYDAPIVQAMYLDHPLKEHTLLQAIARVNRPYTAAKTYGLIVDYCGITKELQKALAIFDEQDIKDVLLPIEREVEELKIRHREVMSFFSDIDDRNNNDLIIEKFEPVHVRDNFEYAFKMFSKALDAVMPRKEADPFIDDFKYLSQKRQLLRNQYGSYGMSYKLEGQKVQQLVDDYIYALRMENLIDFRKVTNETFLVDILKFKSEKARTALVKNKIRQIIEEKKNENPVYYEKIKERLEKLIDEEERKRRESAKYFNKYKEILEDLFEIGKERKRLGFINEFEHAVYELLLKITRDERFSKKITKKIYEDIKSETEIIGWKTKRDSQKMISRIIYDDLQETNNKKLIEIEDEISDLTETIADLAKENL